MATVIGSGLTPISAAMAAADLKAQIPGSGARTASFTLALVDAGVRQTSSGATDITLTIPLNSSVALPVFTSIPIARLGSGRLTIVAAAGVTLNSVGSLRDLAFTGSSAELWQSAANVWWLFGDLA